MACLRKAGKVYESCVFILENSLEDLQTCMHRDDQIHVGNLLHGVRQRIGCHHALIRRFYKDRIAYKQTDNQIFTWRKKGCRIRRRNDDVAKRFKRPAELQSVPLRKRIRKLPPQNIYGLVHFVRGG